VAPTDRLQGQAQKGDQDRDRRWPRVPASVKGDDGLGRHGLHERRMNRGRCEPRACQWIGLLFEELRAHGRFVAELRARRFARVMGRVAMRFLLTVVQRGRGMLVLACRGDPMARGRFKYACIHESGGQREQPGEQPLGCYMAKSMALTEHECHRCVMGKVMQGAYGRHGAGS
jgi:hypothetical protein